MGWLDRLFPAPSYDDLRAENRAAGRALSKADARRGIATCALLAAPGAEAMRAEVLALVDGPFDAAARARCDVLVDDAIRATGWLVRPGTVEELWYLEGLFDRFLR